MSNQGDRLHAGLIWSVALFGLTRLAVHGCSKVAPRDQLAPFRARKEFLFRRAPPNRRSFHRKRTVFHNFRGKRPKFVANIKAEHFAVGADLFSRQFHA
jgi:hypothetical protein